MHYMLIAERILAIVCMSVSTNKTTLSNFLHIDKLLGVIDACIALAFGIDRKIL